MEWVKALLEALSSRLFGKGTPKRDFRIKTNLAAQVTDESGQRMEARVANLSSRGLKILIPVILHKDQTIVVQVIGDRDTDQSIRIDARTVWSRKQGHVYECGLEFLSFHDTQYDAVVSFFRDEVKLEVSETARKLRSPRRPTLEYPVRFSSFGDLRVVKGTLQNLSFTGIRFIAEEDVVIGTVLHLTVDLPWEQKSSLTIIATVRRCVGLRKGAWDIGATMHAADEYNHEVLTDVLARHATEDRAVPATAS